MIRRAAWLVLLVWLAAAAGYALASNLSGSAAGCRAAHGHWLLFEQTCRF